MNENYNPELIGCARKLRNNMTKEERHLWFDFLKGLPVVVKRQKVIGIILLIFIAHMQSW